ncbi:hypothetical protein BC827DRAFT_1266698 [Russula dissimulans]|nr:hypothetical protein BC827DRAFT_1266698 [Russula dissimulans]
MADNSWQMAGNAATVASLTFALTGTSVASIYQTYCSPSTSLENSRKELEEVRSRLQALSPERREQIDAACQRIPSSSGESPNSLKALEKTLEILFDLYWTLRNQYAEMPFTESHLPFTTFRQRVGILRTKAKILLTDTHKTTVAFLSVESGSPVGPASEPVIALQLPVPPSPNLMATIAAEQGSSPCADDIPMVFMRMTPVDALD